MVFNSIMAVGAAAAWLTNIHVAMEKSQYLYLAVGSIVPPLGVIRGVFIWFGWAG